MPCRNHWSNIVPQPRSCLLQRKSPLLCRFSDAGNDEAIHALWRPASEKRQGTKSREVGQ